MDLRELAYFVRVAEEGSVRRAAGKLYISQPALSSAIQSLERKLGIELLVRHNRGVSVTSAGQDFLVGARRILHEVESVQQAARVSSEAPTVLRVGAVAGLVAAAELTSPILREYQRAHPDVSLSVRDLTFPDQVGLLANGFIDAAILRLPAEHDELDFVPIASEPRRLFVRTGHELSDEVSVGVLDILDLPTVTLDAPDWYANYWNLNSERGRPLTVASSPPASTLQGLQLTVATSDVILCGCAAIERLAPNPAVSSLALTDTARSTIVVAFRRGDTRRQVRDFVVTAQEVAAEKYHLIPGGAASG